MEWSYVEAVKKLLEVVAVHGRIRSSGDLGVDSRWDSLFGIVKGVKVA